MSVASRPHRRLTIRAPADLATVDADGDGAPAPAGAPDLSLSPGAEPPPAHPQSRRLALTAPTSTEPASGAPEGSGVPGSAAAPAPDSATPAPSARPRRRLALTMPTGMAPEDTPAAAEARKVGKVDTPCYLRRDVAERLEEEFWRRQAEGEACSRSEIIQAALDIALKDPQRLSAAISRLAGRAK